VIIGGHRAGHVAEPAVENAMAISKGSAGAKAKAEAGRTRGPDDKTAFWPT